MNSAQLDNKEAGLEPEGEKGFGYTDAVNRILALEKEVARLRSRFEEILAGTFARTTESSAVVSHGPPPHLDTGPALKAEPSLPVGPAKSAHSADAPSSPRPLTPAEWDPRRKVECPECGKAISADSFSRHRRRIHRTASLGEGSGT